MVSKASQRMATIAAIAAPATAALTPAPACVDCNVAARLSYTCAVWRSFLWVFITLFCAADAAFALEGRVLDLRTGAAIANAEVSILGRSGSAVTDSDGRFTWKPDPAPPFEVL